MTIHETRFRVRYAETDQMGVVYYANYLVYMEMGRVELCRELGLRYRDMEENDQVFLAVVEAKCRYLAPARYDDEIVVQTWIAESHPRMVRFAYEITNSDTGSLLAAGETKHIFCGSNMRPRKLPEKYRATFAVA